MKLEDSTVELIDSMGSDLSVCNAARVSFHKESEWENEELRMILVEIDSDTARIQHPHFIGKLGSGDQKLVKYLAKHNHWSPFAHVFLSFRVKTHIVNERQLFKHVVGLAANSVSRRYVSDEPTFFLPDSWRTRPENVKQGSSETDTVTLMSDKEGVNYDVTINDAVSKYYQISLNMYEHLLESGVAPEQARGVLPLFTNTEWIWSGSLAAFGRVCRQRLDSHAQAEVRVIAQAISDLVPSSMQHSWAALTE